MFHWPSHHIVSLLRLTCPMSSRPSSGPHDLMEVLIFLVGEKLQVLTAQKFRVKRCRSAETHQIQMKTESKKNGSTTARVVPATVHVRRWETGIKRLSSAAPQDYITTLSLDICSLLPEDSRQKFAH